MSDRIIQGARGITARVVCAPGGAMKASAIAAAGFLLAAAFAVVGPHSALAHTPPRSHRVIEVLERSDAALVLRLNTESGSAAVLEYKRGDSGCWVSTLEAMEPGILLGKAIPLPAAPADGDPGVPVNTELIVPLDIEIMGIASAPADDVTVFQCFGGEQAIVLWLRGRVQQIFWAGAFVPSLISLSTAAAEQKETNQVVPSSAFCQQLQRLCCGSVPNPSGLGLLPPNVNACVVGAAYCTAKKHEYCSCLDSACSQDADPDLKLAACMAGAMYCQEGQPMPQVAPMMALLARWGERLCAAQSR